MPRGKYPIRTRKTFPLDKDTAQIKGSVIEIVPGPRPYLWIGNKDTHEFYGTVSLTPAKLRKLKAALSEGSEDA